MHRFVSAVSCLVISVSTVLAQSGGSVGDGVPAFQVRPGYKVTLAAEDFGPARFLQFDDKGTLYVSQPGGRRDGGGGSITSLKDTDNDGVYETTARFIGDKPGVHSMHFFDGWLYYSSSDSGDCVRARDTDGDGVADEIEVVLPEDSVPTGGGHPFRGVWVTADHIFITVSDPGNMTEELDSDRKSVYRFNRDGSGKMRFAHGIRNTEKLQMRPGTDELWGVDHGSDWFGREYGDKEGNQPITNMMPPEELNHFVEGGFYGHPYLVGTRIPRPEFANRADIIELANKTIPPAWAFGAHWAGNGFTFLEKDYFPDHQGDMFIAFHGSWNSTQKVGYRVERVLFDDETGRPYGTLRVVSTMSPEGEIFARPVDCAEAPDGSILFSCDMTHSIYRISRAD
jgi:glucose/arabinose dehydrogenase